MSEIRLNIVDAQMTHEGTIHASMVDRCVAALSSQPETFSELDAALERFVKPIDDRSALENLRPSPEVRLDSWDAGVAVIDLAAQLVASDSTYSEPGSEGSVNYHDGCSETDVSILYRVPDCWEFVGSLDLYTSRALSRRAERSERQIIDARPVIYGRPLLEFVVNEVRKLCSSRIDGQKHDDDLLSGQVSAIHARWLTTGRVDLHNRAPRDVLLAQCEFVDFDLYSRELQWSLQGEAPPCLARESHAYRFAGFGTHENVIYYDLVRHLIWNAVELCCGDQDVIHDAAEGLRSDAERFELQVAHLAKIQHDWLESPQSDCGGRTPANVIENERRRLPLALQPSDLIIDPDCPVCVMSAQDAAAGFGIGFQHFDGSHMDDDFAFSFFDTREAWEEENRRQEEFNREFNRRLQERERRINAGEKKENVDAELGFDYAKSFSEESKLIG